MGLEGDARSTVDGINPASYTQNYKEYTLISIV